MRLIVWSPNAKGRSRDRVEVAVPVHLSRWRSTAQHVRGPGIPARGRGGSFRRELPGIRSAPTPGEAWFPVKWWHEGAMLRSYKFELQCVVNSIAESSEP